MSPSDRERSLPASRLVRRRSGRDALHDPKVEAHTSTGRNECAHARLASGFARSFGGGGGIAAVSRGAPDELARRRVGRSAGLLWKVPGASLYSESRQS